VPRRRPRCASRRLEGRGVTGALTQIRSDRGPAGANTLAITTEGTGRGRITTLTRTTDGYAAVSRSVTLAYDPAPAT
jgi:hypothetical protein